ncbi:NLR family CARD domain-containing protein 3 [Labeo rohita]|uniref:NLR family CARD domain-containing protein 3 n=1 Tax=Labeo rohita TaxID=84645 RepID=A0ABQ8L4Q3_LABRO|nr:NLR family CARD domain-containing protein 3 [Labeo rohita]
MAARADVNRGTRNRKRAAPGTGLKMKKRSSSHDPSCVSLKSNRSLPHPPDLSDGAVTSDPSSVNRDDQTRDPPQAVNDELQRVKEQHKTSMKIKYERLFEGNKLQKNETLLNRIYTQLYIIEGDSEGVNEEHEFVQMKKTGRTKHSQDTPIYCNDIFKSSPEPGCEEKDQIKTVLTKGIAGIGKTVSVQKFILDWAEGKDNQDVDFMFVLPFRELNLIRDHQYSLHRLLLDFHPELQDLDSKIYEECKVVFIFDGLDESRITLMFSDDQKVCDVTETSSVGVLMSNLMKGELLPSALIWITSRPAAANQIPSKYINRLTEIQGFNESQKEEYFRKRISDQHQASRIISHIRRARSLHIMCHIPVFCWISSTVLQKLLEEDVSAEIPQTLTEMYIHFLLIQINMRNQKYEERDPEKLLQSNREVIVKLAEVAFKQLMKGNVMFYEEDLIESGIDVTDASEFLAAFHEFYCCLTKNKEPLHEFSFYGFDNSLYYLLRSAVNKSLKSVNGHLDLFLRFMLGVSLESNQRLLQNLLTHTENSSENIMRTTHYIKEKIKDTNDDYHLSAGQSMNLFLCLLEVKDQTLSIEIEMFVKSEKLSPACCSTIAYMLQMSEEPLDELDLKKYITSDEGRRRLIPACDLSLRAPSDGTEREIKTCREVAALVSVDLDSKIYEECKVVFIFDGLDESRITLMFSDDQKVCDVTETSSVGVLMSNLMKGELLPSALIWITSRPAAANQIPSKYINRLTEIQGFNESQKEEYFRKRISDQHQASRIISHIRRARSLHIMCHIPVFCWISSTINMRNQKYEERDPEKLLQSNREVIVKLAEVAFNQLMKGNVMFYEEDLIESGIEVTDASVSAVDKALQSVNGHLDLFLRFLLGVSLESNQRLLQDLLTHTENSSENIRRTTHYIKEKIKSLERYK